MRNPLRLVALLAFWTCLCAAQQPIAPPVLQPFADNKQWMLVRDVKIEAVPQWRDSKLLSPLERLILEYAEAMTATPPIVDDELVKKLRVHLNEAQLVELTAIICLENVRSRFNSAVGLTRQGFKDRCGVPLLKGRA
jgi:hypothetical protein